MLQIHISLFFRTQCRSVLNRCIKSLFTNITYRTVGGQKSVIKMAAAYKTYDRSQQQKHTFSIQKRNASLFSFHPLLTFLVIINLQKSSRRVQTSANRNLNSRSDELQSLMATSLTKDTSIIRSS